MDEMMISRAQGGLGSQETVFPFQVGALKCVWLWPTFQETGESCFTEGGISDRVFEGRNWDGSSISREFGEFFPTPITDRAPIYKSRLPKA